MAELIMLAKNGDEDAFGVTVRRMKDIVRRIDEKVIFSPIQFSIVFSEIMKLPHGSTNDLDALGTIIRQVRTIFGEYHPVLGDLCMMNHRFPNFFVPNINRSPTLVVCRCLPFRAFNQAGLARTSTRFSRPGAGRAGQSVWHLARQDRRQPLHARPALPSSWIV